MISLVVEGFWTGSTRERILSPGKPEDYAEDAKRKLQKKFDKGEAGGVNIRGSEEMLEKARIRKISRLQQENDVYKKALAGGKKAGDVAKEEPGIISKAVKKAGEYAPYAAGIGLAAYAGKKLLDRNKAKQQPSNQQNQMGGL